MGRKQLVRGERVVDAIRESPRPFVTTGDIAEYLDVTSQAVRDNANELAEHSALEKGKVAQSSVYWLSENSTPAEVTEVQQPPEPIDPESTKDRDAVESTEERESILDRLLTDSNRSSMDTPGLFVLGLFVAVVGLVGLRAFSELHQVYRTANGLETTLGEISRSVGYAAIIVTSGVVSVFAGYAGAAFLWSYNPTATVLFVIAYVGFRYFEWRAIQPNQTTGVQP